MRGRTSWRSVRHRLQKGLIAGRYIVPSGKRHQEGISTCALRIVSPGLLLLLFCQARRRFAAGGVNGVRVPAV